MKTVKSIFIIVVFISGTLTFCQTSQKEFPVLKGPYLGQKPPGMIPELFPPEPLQADSTWFWHGAPMFSPNLKEIFFMKFNKQQPGTVIQWMQSENNQWTYPQPTSFTHPNYRDNNPFFAQSDDTVYFFTSRHGGNIMYTIREGKDWSQPVKLAIPMITGKNLGQQFSITKNGTIYGELWKADDSDGDIYRWQFRNGKFSAPEYLGDSINSPQYDFTPFIDPDERFLFFCSSRPGGFGKNDIYISFRNNDGTWTKALNLGPQINSADEEAFPSLSPDRKYFIFCREGKYGFNPYWVDANIIGKIKTLRKSK